MAHAVQLDETVNLEIAISRRGNYKIGSECDKCSWLNKDSKLISYFLGKNKDRGCKRCKAACKEWNKIYQLK